MIKIQGSGGVCRSFSDEEICTCANFLPRRRGKVVGRLSVPLSELMEEGRSGSVTDAKGAAQGALWSFDDMELGEWRAGILEPVPAPFDVFSLFPQAKSFKYSLTI